MNLNKVLAENADLRNVWCAHHNQEVSYSNISISNVCNKIEGFLEYCHPNPSKRTSLGNATILIDGVVRSYRRQAEELQDDIFKFHDEFITRNRRRVDGDAEGEEEGEEEEEAEEGVDGETEGEEEDEAEEEAEGGVDGEAEGEEEREEEGEAEGGTEEGTEEGTEGEAEEEESYLPPQEQTRGVSKRYSDILKHDELIRRKRRRVEIHEGEETHGEAQKEVEVDGQTEGGAEGRAGGEAQGEAEGGVEGEVEGEAEGRAEGEAQGGVDVEEQAEGGTERRAEGVQLENEELWTPTSPILVSRSLSQTKKVSTRNQSCQTSVSTCPNSGVRDGNAESRRPYGLLFIYNSENTRIPSRIIVSSLNENIRNLM